MKSLYLIGILALGIVLRLVALDQSFWLDEAAQAIISMDPFQPGHFNGDFQPPLSYYLTHVWMRIGALVGTQAEWFLRLPMVAWGVATIYVLYRYMRSLYDERVSLFAALLLATAPYHVYFSQEHRMYAMFTCVALLSWHAVWQKKWGWVAIWTALGIFTHYFMSIVIVSQALYVVWHERKQWKHMALALALGTAPFALWMPTFMAQLETAGALTTAWPGWSEVSNAGFIRFPGFVAAKFAVGMISPAPRWLYAAAVGLWGILITGTASRALYTASQRVTLRKPLAMLACMTLVPLMAAWIGGIFIPASSPWRVQFVLPGLYALVAVGLLSFWEARRTRVAAIACGLYLIMHNVSFTSHYLLNPAHHRENWRAAIEYSDSAASEGAIILSEYTHPWAPMQWYSRHQSRYFGASTEQRMTQESVNARLDDVLEKGGQHVVVYSYLFEISDPQRIVEASLVEREYVLEEEKDFRGVGIVRTYAKRSF